MSEPRRICQSCAKPLDDQNAGHEADGSRSEKYCSACYHAGSFTRDVTLEQMQQIVGASIADKPIPAFARSMIVADIEGLERWRSDHKTDV